MELGKEKMKHLSKYGLIFVIMIILSVLLATQNALGGCGPEGCSPPPNSSAKTGAAGGGSQKWSRGGAQTRSSQYGSPNTARTTHTNAPTQGDGLERTFKSYTGSPVNARATPPDGLKNGQDDYNRWVAETDLNQIVAGAAGQGAKSQEAVEQVFRASKEDGAQVTRQEARLPDGSLLIRNGNQHFLNTGRGDQPISDGSALLLATQFKGDAGVAIEKMVMSNGVAIGEGTSYSGYTTTAAQLLGGVDADHIALARSEPGDAQGTSSIHTQSPAASSNPAEPPRIVPRINPDGKLEYGTVGPDGKYKPLGPDGKLKNSSGLEKWFKPKGSSPQGTSPATPKLGTGGTVTIAQSTVTVSRTPATTLSSVGKIRGGMPENLGDRLGLLKGRAEQMKRMAEGGE